MKTSLECIPCFFKQAQYAASIARFSTVQINGIVGIPADLEASYWQKSYDASKTLIEQGPHSLYRKNADPMLNYRYLFNDEIESNPEVIFTERTVFKILRCNIKTGYISARFPFK